MVGGGPSLKDLFDPAAAEFRLRYYGWSEWRKLPPAEKKRSLGVDPEKWLNPPPDKEDDEKKEPKKDPDPGGRKPKAKQQDPPGRYPGFRFEQRLEEKQAAFNQLVGPGAPSTVEGLIKQLKRIDRAELKIEKLLAPVTEDYAKVKKQVDKASEVQIRNYKKKTGKLPDQVLLPRSLLNDFHKKSKLLQKTIALMQSEHQFHDWVVVRVGELLAALQPAERVRPIAGLKAGALGKSWQHRIRCGQLLATLDDPAAREVFRAALAAEQDPIVLRAHIEVAARARIPGLLDLLKERLADANWPVRAAVIEALAEQRTKEAVDLLIAQLDKEKGQGRLQDDLVDALARLTGRRMEPDSATWKLWWDKARATWTPPKETEAAGVQGSDKDGVYFYGIRTRSKRIVFCIDISGSMEFPLDGRNGKKPPRIQRAKVELIKALNALRPDCSFAIVVYNAKVSSWNQGKMKLATTKTKKTARKYVENLEPLGATNIYDALVTSLRIAGPPRGKNKEPRGDTIFFLTDGQPTHGRIVDAMQILQEITRLNRQYGVVIHTVGVSKEQNAGFLLNLAKRNRGQYVAYK